MFGIILITVITLVQIYIFWRIMSVPFIRQRIPRKIPVILGILLWVLFVAARLYGHRHTGTDAVILEFLGMNWMGFVFLIFVCMLVVDIITLFGLLIPRIAAKLRTAALGIGILFSVIALIQGLRPPVIQPYEVTLPGLPENLDGTVMVAVSDLHVGTIIGEDWLDARVDQINAEKPDMVVLLGDILEGHEGRSEQLLPILNGLSPTLGIWSVLGNHEFYRRRDDAMKFNQAGYFNLLRNRWEAVRPSLILAGVDDLTVLRRRGEGGDPVSMALKGRPTGATIFLSHTPWESEKASSLGVGLMLSAHTHNGQIWPFGYLVRRVYPYLGGRYDVNGMTLIVCRGTGTWGPRMRLWRPGEILRITLHAGPSEEDPAKSTEDTDR